MNEKLRESFLRAAESWASDGCQLTIQYLAVREAQFLRLSSALISLNPLPHSAGTPFGIEFGRMVAGQVQLSPQQGVQAALREACGGHLNTDELNAAFPGVGGLDYFSDNPDPNRPGLDLHLRISAENNLSFASDELIELDAQLRRTDPPFDGLADLCNSLKLQNPASHSRRSEIDIRIHPPVDFAEEPRLENGLMNLALQAAADVDIAQIEVAVHCTPSVGLGRYLIGKLIQWTEPSDGLRKGRVNLDVESADIVKCMLSLGPRTIRRSTLVDRTRARSSRLAAVMAFDPGLSALSSSLRRSAKDRDADRFEKGVATLLFLYGFLPAPLVDTDAPDLLVGTPGGRLAVIECTLKFNDFNAKVAKLVERRNQLVSELRLKGHALEVHAVVVCATARSEIVGLDDAELVNQNVTLITSETLQDALNRVQTPVDPDTLLVGANDALAEAQHRLNSVV